MQTENTQANQASKASDFQQAAPILAPSAGQRALNPNTLGTQNQQLTVSGAPFQAGSTQDTPATGFLWPLFLIIAMLLAAAVVFLVAVSRIIRPLPEAISEDIKVEAVKTAAPKKTKKTKPKKKKRR